MICLLLFGGLVLAVVAGSLIGKWLHRQEEADRIIEKYFEE